MDLLLVPGGVISHLHFLPLWKWKSNCSKISLCPWPSNSWKERIQLPLYRSPLHFPPRPIRHSQLLHQCCDTSGHFPDALWPAVASVRELTAFLTVSSFSPTWNYSLSVPSPFCFLWFHSTKMQESPLHPLALVRIQCRHTLCPAALWNVELLLCWVAEKRGCTWISLTFPALGSVPGT